MIDVFLFILGIIFGSFLNVCITRLPLKKSIISPSSSCPNCKQRIKPYHNIPIISYIILTGKCYFCKWPIPKRYLIVEFLSGSILILLHKYFEIIESLPYTIGEHIWNFADFRTAQHFRRVVLNKKGVFNRQREPKAAAFKVRSHWLKK